ncbi:hypothetical protein [Aeromonas sp. SCS5]|uniref:hypothetical protein n=1 Tax=Aeromonas sp. SCS5 TaxID=1519205 RepID=UPI0011786EA5|nr:hypothetical protein [Aeromonas sp. SCS5]
MSLYELHENMLPTSEHYYKYEQAINLIAKDKWSVYRVNGCVIAIKMRALQYMQGYIDNRSFFVRHGEWLQHSFRCYSGNFETNVTNLKNFGRSLVFVENKCRLIGTYDNLLDIPIPKKQNNNHEIIKTKEELSYSSLITF